MTLNLWPHAYDLYISTVEEKVRETFYLNDRNTTTSPALRLVLFI